MITESEAAGGAKRAKVNSTPNPAKEVITDSAEALLTPASAWPPAPGRSPQSSSCEPYREFIADALARRRNGMVIWQDLVGEYGFTGRYSAVQRFIRKLKGGTATEARVVIETELVCA